MHSVCVTAPKHIVPAIMHAGQHDPFPCQGISGEISPEAYLRTGATNSRSPRHLIELLYHVSLVPVLPFNTGSATAKTRHDCSACNASHLRVNPHP